MARESVFGPGLRALKRAWAPMVLIQAVLVAVVVGFFVSPGVGEVLGRLADVKDAWGVWMAVATGFVAGGFVPEGAKALTGRMGRVSGKWLADTLYTGFVYSIVSVGVWILYALMEDWFGPTRGLGELVPKVLLDQLVFSVFFSIPFAYHMFTWRDRGFAGSYWRRVFSWEVYRREVAPGLVMCWAFWGPAVTCIYVFPERLQFVVSMLCQGVWSLVFVLMVRDTGVVPEAPPE